ncbi:AP2/ERF domain-containing protein [Forsythia ovata]|uniref:AP2/ERF domain-containing protein n=1 Tax=Forsythia ovata TaxID=205694 RepID=A0ABD1WQK8_9LAMI
MSGESVSVHYLSDDDLADEDSNDDDFLLADDFNANFRDMLMIGYFVANERSIMDRTPCRTSLLTGKIAYDTAVYYLRGPSAKLNFPDEIFSVTGGLTDFSAASIRKKAAEVGARVDALQTNTFTTINKLEQENLEKKSLKPSWFQEKIDLNKKPEPEILATFPQPVVESAHVAS